MKHTFVQLVLILFATDINSQVKWTNRFDTEAFYFLIPKESHPPCMTYYGLGGVINPLIKNIDCTKNGLVTECINGDDPKNFSFTFSVQLGRQLKGIQYYDLNNYALTDNIYTVDAKVEFKGYYQLVLIERGIPYGFFTPKGASYEPREVHFTLNSVKDGLNEVRTIALKHFIKMYMSIEDHYCSLTYECDEENDMRLYNNSLGGRFGVKAGRIFYMDLPNAKEVKELYLLNKDKIGNIKDYLIEESPDYSLLVLGGLLSAAIVYFSTVNEEPETKDDNQSSEPILPVTSNTTPVTTSNPTPVTTSSSAPVTTTSSPVERPEVIYVSMDSIGFTISECPRWDLMPVLYDQCWKVVLDSECGDDCGLSSEVTRHGNTFSFGLFTSHYSLEEATKDALEYLLEACCGILAIVK